MDLIGAKREEILAVSAKDGTGVPELRRLLATAVQAGRSKCRHTWLPGWAQVLDELANSSKAYLRWQDRKRNID